MKGERAPGGVDGRPGALPAALPGVADPPGARAALERLRGFGGDGLVRDMAAIFLADMPARRARTEAGLAAGDLGAVAHAAHTMKSSALQFGAAALGRLCGDAELAARSGDREALGRLVPAMGRELDGFGRWLAGAVGGPAGAR